jgi:hypothetical protein
MSWKQKTITRTLGFGLVGLALGFALAPPALPAGPESRVEILELTVDPAFPPTFNQELKLRVRVINRGPAAAKGAALEAKSGATPVGRAELGALGAGEQRTLTFATRFRPGSAETCLTIAPVVSPDSPAKAGRSRQLCLTPGCYSVSERPGN